MAREQMSTLPALQMKRTFQAPRERVFRAWTDPVELARWFGPTDDHHALVRTLDLRVGGEYYLEIHHKGGNVHRVLGTYREIKSPEKIVFTWRWEGDPIETESLVTVEFRDMGVATEILLTHAQLPDGERRDRHEQGWTGGLNRLSNYLNM
jgi:uncharacterized protein YndB with AHSA1/START domain